MNDAEQLLKVDVAGRVWTPRARREALLDEQREGVCSMSSGKGSVRAYVQKRD